MSLRSVCPVLLIITVKILHILKAYTDELEKFSSTKSYFYWMHDLLQIIQIQKNLFTEQFHMTWQPFLLYLKNENNHFLIYYPLVNHSYAFDPYPYYCPLSHPSD